MTSYRYFDDITVFSTVDLATNRVVKVEAAQHLRTPLSQTEFDEAKEMAREKSAEVKQLYERFGDQLSVYPQFSQFTVKDDPRVHRVVHLTYRVGKRDLSYPRPQVDLTIARGRDARSRATRARAQGRAAARNKGWQPRRQDVGRNQPDRYQGTPHALARLFAPVRYSCFWPCRACRRRRRRSGFFRQSLADPPAQEVTDRILDQRVGRAGAAQRNRLEGSFRPRRAQGALYHRGLVQARPERRLDQGLERRPHRRAVRPVSSVELSSATTI